ncbi:6331_t:CDS:2 [Paraglomus brasilianum]|uniref:6331_t:CDS:1 n=1 Tax=Paraglomus brasilianum TaxID=144538 RepID=A0A9N9H139_9GLOM|nr:6331_t:CDS:2 [Paraglomus brasilianum]
MHLELLSICKYFKSWKLSRDKEEKKGEISWVMDVRDSLKKFYEMHKTKPLGSALGKMYRLASQIYQRLRWPGEPMKKLTKEEEKRHKSAKECKYRGPAHSICNLQLQIKPEEAMLLIRFHNMEKYDAHFIAKAMGRISQEEIKAIPHNMEKLFKLRYWPSEVLKHVQKRIAKSLDIYTELIMIDVLPTQRDSQSHKMDVTKLPPIEAFSSILNKSTCAPKDYERAQEVWKAFGMKTFREYHDLYLKLDVLLLADVFEANRKMMKAKFGLDIAHYVSLPSFAEDSLYKMTGQKIELFTDNNMYFYGERDDEIHANRRA